MPLAISIISLLPNEGAFAQSSHLTIEDSRDLITHPSDYSKVIRPAFKRNTSLGLPADASYSTLVGFKGWAGDTGGPAHELAFMQTKGIRYRTGTNAAGWSAWRRVLAENVQGNVGIGTDTPRERLSVNGNIRAKEIKVEANNWPDYVFQENYHLRPLAEVKDYIKVNGHLPEIPSAKEVEEQGLSLGEMNELLLKKVEELTLYLIERDERIENIEKELTEIKKNLR
ncbi:hypothetical protein C5745_18900 [Sphingobacterium haloxyli]|uniref:Uncharacterized protein n=1 Tax=Sphingobacterium haloxyli TaxID=2100533 RepID=A0A2S9IWV1_9SPHI|nr:hypothetical protein C5745_18900 [Sphingobacterium haloxyli]